MRTFLPISNSAEPKYEPFTRYPDVVIVSGFGGIRGRGYGKDKRKQLLGIRIDIATGDFLNLPFECSQLGCGLIVGIQGFLSSFLRHRVNRVARFVAALAVAWRLGLAGLSLRDIASLHIRFMYEARNKICERGHSIRRFPT
jgi:hypothetical protein